MTSYKDKKVKYDFEGKFISAKKFEHTVRTNSVVNEHSVITNWFLSQIDYFSIQIKLVTMNLGYNEQKWPAPTCSFLTELDFIGNFSAELERYFMTGFEVFLWPIMRYYMTGFAYYKSGVLSMLN